MFFLVHDIYSFFGKRLRMRGEQVGGNDTVVTQLKLAVDPAHYGRYTETKDMSFFDSRFLIHWCKCMHGCERSVSLNAR